MWRSAVRTSAHVQQRRLSGVSALQLADPGRPTGAAQGVVRAAALQAEQSPGKSVEGLRSLFSHPERESVDARATSARKAAGGFVSDGAPDFPEVGVPQGRVRSDALVRVVGQHLVEQREGWRRAFGDQAGDPGAFFRGEVEMHGPGPARGSEQEVGSRA